MRLPPQTQVNRATKILTVVLYLPFVPGFFDPKCQAAIVRAFGVAPLGIPAKAFFPLLVTCLYLPAPWFLSHFTKVMLYELREGSFGIIGVVLSLLDFSPEQAPLFRSKVVSLVGIIYFLVMVGTWIFLSTTPKQ